MSAYHLYLSLPVYLAQWYAYECRRNQQAAADTFSVPVYKYPEPIHPLRGSVESDILATYLTKQPSSVPEDFREGATLVLVIPSFRHRDPQIYNYLPPKAREYLTETIRRRFKCALWRDINKLDPALQRKDLAIAAWMEKHGIDDTETNYNSILKIYDRAYNTYRQSELRKAAKNAI